MITEGDCVRDDPLARVMVVSTVSMGTYGREILEGIMIGLRLLLFAR